MCTDFHTSFVHVIYVSLGDPRLVLGTLQLIVVRRLSPDDDIWPKRVRSIQIRRSVSVKKIMKWIKRNEPQHEIVRTVNGVHI